MSALLLPVWHEIEKYIDMGISVLPVRDATDESGIAKSPFGSWKPYQFKIVSKDELFELMDIKYNTTAIGIIGGKVSGNLEIIDIDVKYFPGIDSVLFTDLKTLYPELFGRLRIHKSPSGGYHILYRCEVPVPGNQKLAGRLATPEELIAAPKTKIYNFLETRGEGGYVLAPPSLGYKVVKDCAIPVLTEMERASIISLCRSYGEIVTPAMQPYTPSKQESTYYDTNPFEDYNNRINPDEIMQDLGYKYFKGNNHFRWFTRPGKDTGTSISFNLHRRFFFNFTASTELEENKGYTPVNLLSILKFNNDKKRLYQYLTGAGYGKIKPAVEQSIAKRAATNGKPLPKNISSDAISIHAAISATLSEQHPHGVYWIDSPDKGVLIDRELFYNVASELGFKLIGNRLIQSDGNYIDDVDDRHFFDSMKQYIKEDDADLNKDICNAYESFIEKHGKFTISRLPILPDHFILRDTKEAAYKVYLNVILKITATGITKLESVPQLIWKKSVQQRDYNEGTGGRYIEFLKLATDFGASPGYIKDCIGYLSHEYKDSTAGYIIVLTEQCENPKDGGGAGKNVFSELFKNTTTFLSKPGSQVKYDEKFMQSWNHQKIFCLSDVHKHFNFAFLKELSTGTGLMKKLFKDEQEIPSDMMPKFLVQTNFSPKITDGGVRRRVRIIEFTDFFTKTGGIDVHFKGVYFPDEWNADDWAGYDTMMATSIQQWLKNGRRINEPTLSQGGWAKQFENEFGELLTGFIKENISEWVRDGFVSNDYFQDQKNKYLKENDTAFFSGKGREEAGGRFILSALGKYCEHHEILFDPNKKKSVDGVKVRGKQFLKMSETPF